MKIKIKKQIHHLYPKSAPKYKDIKDLNLEDEDEIIMAWDEGFYSENNSWDPHWFISINRMVEETDEEEAERIEDNRLEKIRLKDRRRETYLLYKKEFEKEGI